MSNARAFTTETWDEDVLRSSKPALVDFWAVWCAPCRMMAPAIDELAKEFDGRASVGKLNVDDNAAVSDRYDIRGIPTVIVFKGSEIREHVIGITSKANLTAMLEKHLN